MKIVIKLDHLAAKLGKTISDIAQETGLNRNTITAIFHNDVDGIKFDTLEKICSTYNLTLSDLIEMSNPIPKKIVVTNSITVSDPYKQEGNFILFTGLPPFVGAHNLSTKYFLPLDGVAMYFIKEYGQVYWPKESMGKSAEFSYEILKDPIEFEKLYQEFEIAADKIKSKYFDLKKERIIALSDQDLVVFAHDMWENFQDFWKPSIFIDFFDAGYDVKKISEIQKQYGFTDDEVRTLTTPEQMTFTNERLLLLFELIKKLVRRGLTKPADIKKAVRTWPEFTTYVSKFDYYKSNYAFINHIGEDELIEEILKLLKNNWKEEYTKLKVYTAKVQKDTAQVLKKYKLKANPLYFFERLVFWREYRKQVNLMGIHLLHYILLSIEEKTGIPHKYLKHLTAEEVPNVLTGLVGKKQLQSRYEQGIVVSTVGGKLRVIEGDEAQSVHEELEKHMVGKDRESIISGRVVCQGYAKGIARIIYGQEDFARFKEGEILVTGMTRPEFVPLMKKAAGIVTNEGGVTCHAAIVSRELGKPCIIGTQKATRVIKDGDLVEVRANHGTVRILS